MQVYKFSHVEFDSQFAVLKINSNQLTKKSKLVANLL
jgi:hypothetical protein